MESNWLRVTWFAQTKKKQEKSRKEEEIFQIKRILRLYFEKLANQGLKDVHTALFSSAG